MPVQTFTDAVVVDGSQDIAQLRVQAHSTQNQPLQTWETSGANVLSQITNDGRLEVGNNAVGGTPAALIEANQGSITSAAAVKQGIQTRGVVNGAINEPFTWSIHELEFTGVDGVSSTQAALRSRLTHDNSGGGASAEMRAADFEVNNLRTLNKAVGVRSALTNANGITITEAAAFEAVLPTTGTINILYGLHIPDLTVGTTRYAIHTGQGLVRLGDAVELRELAVTPATPPQDVVRVYPKPDGKVYAKNDAGVEYDLTEGISAATCDGRLTLTTGAAFPTSDVSAASTLYFTRCRGDKIALYDSTRWRLYPIPAGDVSLSLSGLTANHLYDIFIYDNAGTLTLEATGWAAPSSGNITGASHSASPIVITSNGHGLTNNQLVTISGVGGNTAANGTWRVANVTTNTFELKTLVNGNSTSNATYTSGGTWARADASASRATSLALQDGIYVLSGDATRRYLGTIRITNVAGQSESTQLRRFVWNYYHRVSQTLFKSNGAGHGYSSAVMRPWGDDLANRLEYVIGVVEERPKFWYSGRIDFGAGNIPAILNFGGDSPSGGDAHTDSLQATAAGMILSAWGQNGVTLPSAGYHYLQMTEYGGNLVTFQTFRFAGEIFG